ncbi:Hint domain-containing protein [Thalassovita sp.]|uniref:Hint domain-containing protein n=1 Tax=Thalassovita sp. TaxID=1979401 RepID=UPI0029DE56C4|nr:Hint domain-containing protein [Thalassovita sp.]
MSWIGLTDRTTAQFHMGGLGRRHTSPQGPLAPFDLMPRGTLMLETGIPSHSRPQRLLSYHHLHPWERGLALHSLPDGSVVLVVTQDTSVVHTVLFHGLIGQEHRLRVTYVWDAPARTGLLSVKAIGTGRHFLQPVQSPVPLSLGDLQALFLHPRSHDLDPEVTFAALSDHPQPVGPMPSLAPDVPVLTDLGYRPLHSLKRGNLVRTPDGELVPILANLSFTAPACGSFRPVHLRAPYFGLRSDITVAPDQRLCVSGSDVEYLFGSPSVLVPARHLVNGVSAWYADTGPTATWHQLLLPKAQPIVAAGAALQSLYLGRMRRRADHVAASLLARHDRSRLPEHARPPFPVLRPFEAVTLVQHRAA